MKQFVVIALLAIVGLSAAQDFNLQDLNFGDIIGGPLSAAVEAQAAAAQASIDLISAVGISNTTGTKEVVMVDFDYTARDTNTGDESRYTFKIPFLTLIPVPFLQIDSVNINFKMAVNRVESAASSQSVYGQIQDSNDANAVRSLQAQRAASFSTPVYNPPVFRGAVTSQWLNTNSNSNAQFSYEINVKAGQADVPRGLDRLLSLFESIITDRSPSANVVP